MKQQHRTDPNPQLSIRWHTTIAVMPRSTYPIAFQPPSEVHGEHRIADRLGIVIPRLVEAFRCALGSLLTGCNDRREPIHWTSNLRTRCDGSRGTSPHTGPIRRSM